MIGGVNQSSITKSKGITMAKERIKLYEVSGRNRISYKMDITDLGNSISPRIATT